MPWCVYRVQEGAHTMQGEDPNSTHTEQRLDPNSQPVGAGTITALSVSAIVVSIAVFHAVVPGSILRQHVALWPAVA